MKKLTLVYVDYGALTNPDTQELSVTPERISSYIKELSRGSNQTLQRFFVDSRGVEKPGGRERHNGIVARWMSYQYRPIECPRRSDMGKETIDAVMVENIHEEVEIFQSLGCQLHVILVVGDAGYRNLILTLLKKGVRVSIIATYPHASLTKEILSQCYACYALFNIESPEEGWLFRPLEEMPQESLNGSYGAFRAVYEPTEIQAERFIAACATTIICPKCGDSVPTIQFATTHPCFVQTPLHGILTRTYLERTAIHVSEYSPRELFGWFITLLHNEALPNQFPLIVNHMPRISWPVVDALVSVQKIQASGSSGLPSSNVSDEHISLLVGVGLIERRDERLFVTDQVMAIADLIEEARRRTHHPSTARIYAPEGAVKETILRERILSALSDPVSRRVPIANDETTADLTEDETRSYDSSVYHATLEDPLLDSDLGLSRLTEPGLSQTTRLELQDQRDSNHTVNEWAKRIVALLNVEQTDVLSVIEHVTSDNPFATERSISILIANGIFVFDELKQTLVINNEHLLFAPFLRRKDVA